MSMPQMIHGRDPPRSPWHPIHASDASDASRLFRLGQMLFGCRLSQFSEPAEPAEPAEQLQDATVVSAKLSVDVCCHLDISYCISRTKIGIGRRMVSILNPRSTPFFLRRVGVVNQWTGCNFLTSCRLNVLFEALSRNLRSSEKATECSGSSNIVE